jgi:hypothetical protein
MTTISDQLREAIRTCGKSRYRIAAETGIPQSTLSRFVNGHTDLNLRTVDEICRCIGARLTIDRPTRTKATKRPARKAAAPKLTKQRKGE